MILLKLSRTKEVMDRRYSWEQIIHSLHKKKIQYIVFQTNLGVTYVKNLGQEGDYNLSFKYINDPDSHEMKGWKVCKSRSKADKYKESFMYYEVKPDELDSDSITLSEDDEDDDVEIEENDGDSGDSGDDVKNDNENESKCDVGKNSEESEVGESDSDFNEGEISVTN